jgi:hypothetical protein
MDGNRRLSGRGPPQSRVVFNRAGTPGLDRPILFRRDLLFLPDTYGLSHESIARLMNEWRAKALATSTVRPAPLAARRPRSRGKSLLDYA